jgi:N-methylhydantoinase B/oxoprolinase/acetone carboxylase alpha subunit
VNTTGVEMTEDEKNQAAAYIKLQDDVKELVKEALIEVLMTYNHDVVKRIQDITLGNPAFDIRVKQVITNQMQR